MICHLLLWCFKVDFLLQAEGYEVIACVAVNDPYVMSAWGKDLQTEGKVGTLKLSNSFPSIGC